MFTGTLSQNAQDALAVLKKLQFPKKTYLAGGSALALHYGHRISIDFDFFTPFSFSQKKIVENLEKIGKFNNKRLMKDTILGNFNGVQFSLFHYDYPLLYQTINFVPINLADPRDIAAMKIAAIMDRGTKKDFIDLYFLNQKGIFLEDCLRYYDKKYSALASNIYSIIVSLSYFTNAEESEMPQMLEKISWIDVKKFFANEAVRLANKFL